MAQPPTPDCGAGYGSGTRSRGGGFKGTPCGRASRGRAPSAPGAPAATRHREPGAGSACLRPGWLASGGHGCGGLPLARGGHRQPPRVTWPRIPARRRATVTRPVTAGCPAGRPSLSRRSSCRRAKITVIRALRPAPPRPLPRRGRPLTLIFRGKTSAPIERDGAESRLRQHSARGWPRERSVGARGRAALCA